MNDYEKAKVRDLAVSYAVFSKLNLEHDDPQEITTWGAILLADMQATDVWMHNREFMDRVIHHAREKQARQRAEEENSA